MNVQSPLLSGIAYLLNRLHRAVASRKAKPAYPITLNGTNIRYAEPPVGELRFAKPVAPRTNRSQIQDGLDGASCFQAIPDWGQVASQFVPAYLEGKALDVSKLNSSATNWFHVGDTPMSEDCLFLDVYAPKTVLEGAEAQSIHAGAPVLVWIYGGGYVFGSKEYWGNPATLIESSSSNHTEGVIFIALNYRLGAFGWLAGPSLQSNGTANAGLFDQRLALNWIQQYVRQFGGDPERVTVMGESAGGGSIMLQITAYGGAAGPAPFHQAIPQSPAIQPLPSPYESEVVTNDFLSILNASSVQSARQLSSNILARANSDFIARSPYGRFTFGPVVDGSFVPAMPGNLLLQGAFDHSVKLLLGHNSDEGILFTTPFLSNETDFVQYWRGLFPVAQPKVLDYIVEVLYPPIYDGSYGYTDIFARSSQLVADVVIVCNTYFLDKAFQNKTRAYLFGVPPGLHAMDVPYTFYNGPSSEVKSPDVALAMQRYFTSFAGTGVPRASGLPTITSS
ncbi:hypothetical protein LTR86_005841 [Recurvomyces mirabilis]|nr:hypothetical protein LTR86_005841 [Recurvomyces mirabilis]